MRAHILAHVYMYSVHVVRIYSDRFACAHINYYPDAFCTSNNRDM